jgi:hypothetical protein
MMKLFSIEQLKKLTIINDEKIYRAYFFRSFNINSIFSLKKVHLSTIFL